MLITDDSPTLYDCVKLYGEDWAGAMGDYPIWDETRRAWLNERIFEHFAYREIGQDTPADHFRLLRRTMHEMMPALNPLFSALESEFSILDGYEQTSTSRTENSGGTKSLYSATPQTQLSGAENYATNLTENEDNTASTSSMQSSGRGAPVGDLLTSWATSVNNALYLVYNGLEPIYQQIFELDPWEVRQWQ